MGIAMMADPNFGETEGGLQAPHVIKEGSEYLMFYGDWEHIALARSQDGKTFARQLGPDGRSGMFGEGPGSNTRDPMVLKIGNLYHCYYTAYPGERGADYVRTSHDLRQWSEAKKVSWGGSPGNGKYAAECPFVYFHKPSGYYYLLRNQFYGAKAKFTVYRSRTRSTSVRTAITHGRDHAVRRAGDHRERRADIHRGAAAELKGIQVARLKFAPR